MDYNPDRLFEYGKSIAQEFQSRLNRFTIFVKHAVTSGTANEVILREFLARHVPGNYDVAQGFITNPILSDEASRQCDILVYSKAHHPLVYSDGPIKVVYPESVLLVMESKTAFNKKDIHTSLENIASAKRLNQNIKGFIFAFTSLSVSKVVEHLSSYENEIDEAYKPEAIFLLDKGAVIHRWMYSRMRDLNVLPIDARKITTYAVRQGNGKTIPERQAVVLTFMLLMFLEVVSHNSDASNTLIRLIDTHTAKTHPDITVGKPDATTT